MGWFAICARGALSLSLILIVVVNAASLAGTADLHEGLAAWVQAVGTVVAIIASGLIASAQSRKTLQLAEQQKTLAEQKVRQRAGILGYRLTLLLVDMDEQLKRAEKSVTALNAGISILQSVTPAQKALEAAISVMALGLDIKEEIYAQLECLPPEVASLITHVLYSVTRYDNNVRLILTHGSKFGPETIQDYPAQAAETHRKMRADMDRATILLAPYVVFAAGTPAAASQSQVRA